MTDIDTDTDSQPTPAPAQPSPARYQTPTRKVLQNLCVFREHESGQDAFIIKSGRIEIYKTVTENNTTREVVLNILEEGTMFGEMALIDNKPRMASARAYGDDATVYVISKQHFETLLKPTNLFVKKLLEILVNLARDAYDIKPTVDTETLDNTS